MTAPETSFRPKTRNLPKKDKSLAPLESLRPVTRSDAQDEKNQMNEAFGNLEFRADMDKQLSWNPLARLGFNPNKTKVLRTNKSAFDARISDADTKEYQLSLIKKGYPEEEAARVEEGDIVISADAANNPTIAHEYTHKGLSQVYALADKDPNLFMAKYGEDSLRLVLKAKPFRKPMRSLQPDEYLTELFDDVNTMFNSAGIGDTLIQREKFPNKNIKFTVSSSDDDSRFIDTRSMLQEKLKGTDKRITEKSITNYNKDIKGIFGIMEAAQDILTEQGEPPKSKVIELSLFNKIKKKLGFAEGGSVNMMDNQMRMFEEGGIADDGLDRDPISGNEIPSGSLASEVRDDIPAQLSEGEYVVPADVVRFFGVKYFEDLRMEAKQGLQTMEQNGRIGGEPTMSQAMPQGNQGSITDEDLAQIEQMFASGVANGGLMDKVAYVAANDPIINRAFNKGGAVVSFAVGGSVQSPFNDPTKVDAVIGKFMQMVQSKPQIMEELSKRGIQVTRTGANQQPQQIQRDNSASQTTEPVMEGKPTPTPEPIRASAGLLAGNTGYIKSPTMVLPAGFKSGYNVPGQSLTYTGPGVPGSTETTVAPAVPVSSGVPAAPVGTPVCPPGQEYDSVAQMCVPRQDYDGSKKDKPPEPPNYDNFMKQYGEVDFSDPEAMKKYIEDVSKPSEFSGVLGPLSMIPNGIGAIIGGIGSAGQVNSYAELKVAELHAIASGDAELLAIAKAGQTKFLAESGKFVNSKLGQFFGGDGAGALKARYANVLEGSGLNLDEVDDWNDTQRKKYKDLTSSKKTKVKVAKKVEAAAILANNSGQIQPRTGDSEQNQGGSTSDQLSNFGVKVTTAPKKDPNYTYVKPTVQVDEPDDYGYEDAMYKGGLIARPKKKKK